MGRPRKTLTSKQLDELETIAPILSQDQIADYFSISRTTFHQMMDREPGISARYKKGRSRTIKDLGQGLIQKALGGDSASAMFYLKCQAGWKEKSQHEISGPDGGAIQTESRITIDFGDGDAVKE